MEAIDRSQLASEALLVLQKLDTEDKRAALEYLESLILLRKSKHESENSRTG